MSWDIRTKHWVSSKKDGTPVHQYLTHWSLGDVTLIWKVLFKPIIQNSILRNCCGIALRWMPQNLTNAKSTMVQVMAWCRQATSHYLSQCRPMSMSPYGVTRPQWVKIPLPCTSIAQHVITPSNDWSHKSMGATTDFLNIIADYG